MDFGAEILGEGGGRRVQGSGLLKTQRSGSGQEGWRVAKAAKSDEFSLFSQGQSHGLLRSGSGLSGNIGQTMISFSSQSQSQSQAQAHVYGDEDVPKTPAFPFFLAPPDPFSPRSASSGYGMEKSSEKAFTRFKGPFTPSQWMELEHQALIYKHIMANVPVPSHLLIPLRKSFNPYVFSSFSSGSYGSNPLGWGSFHLGFSGSTDPEPGRCRRTDGKKWRCSRDAVPDQKYCERHINRGRHRSRKPVESQNGQAVVPGSAAAAKAAMASIASSSMASMMSGNSPSNSLGAVQHQYKNNASSDHDLMSRMQDLHGVPVLGDGINFKPKDSPFSLQKQQVLFGGSEFGLVSPDSLLNPTQKSSNHHPKNSDDPYQTGFSTQDPPNQHHPLRHFIDNWPKDQSNRGAEELKPDWTQLSMSIPMAAADFSSSSNSPRHEINKSTLSPLRLAREMDPIQMGLRVNNQKEANWMPGSWGNSVVGGPLGEVLNSTSVSTEGDPKNTTASVLNLMSESWDNGCSPTGVLQRSTFVSLSNSSSGSSPRADRRVLGGAILCDDLLGSSSSIPSL